ncbi:MAG TPA: thioredoxin family protein [Methanobacterium sp.]|nr:thioredoxin family protein [Methanobacterium sp.]
MNKFKIGLAITLLILLVGGLVLSNLNGNVTQTDTKKSLRWGTDLDKAMQEAKDSNKSIFVDFYADWCDYCGEMDDGTFTDPQIVEKLTQNYVLLKVDVDENPSLSSKYQAYSLPTMLIIDSNGNEIKRIIGYQSPERLLTQI